MRLKVLDSNGVEQIIEAQSIVLADGSFLDGTGGVAHVAIKAQIQFTDYYAQIDGAAGAADNALIYESGDISMLNYIAVENRSAVAVDIFGTLDGTFNASQPAIAVELTDDVTTGGGKSITIPANKTGIVPIARGVKFNKIKVLQAAAGTISAGAVLITLSNV